MELSLFSAQVVKNSVNLNWTTETEVNNFGFDVERKAENSGWEKIGFVEGNGNSNSPKEYLYIDENPIGGKNLKYRLKQIDSDGKFEYSSSVDVEIVPVQFALYQNYPNPFNPTTKIKYQVFKESNISLKVYDILGAVITELVNEKKEPGIFEVNFSGKNLASGNYIYQLQAEDIKPGSEVHYFETRKMLLIK